jgi:hypothetical protein
VHRRWQIEQGYKQVKDELGWEDFQVRSDIAIRHEALLSCAFSFCWAAWFHDHPHHGAQRRCGPGPAAERGGRARPYCRRRRPGDQRCPVDRAAALVAGMVQGAPPPQLQALINSVAAGCCLHLTSVIDRLPIVN